MLYLIGLGLGDIKDITVKGLEIVKRCDKVYLEHYTSILTVGQEELQKFYGREILLADRELVEQGADTFLDEAREEDVAFLVVGDPFGATTHSDLVLRAREKEVAVSVVHNASIMSAVGCCGLQLYNFGETVSIPFWTDTWKPDSFYQKISDNLRRGQHTLCLLDIKVKEQSEENMARGRKIFEPPRFMSTTVACQQLSAVVQKKTGDGCVGVGGDVDGDVGVVGDVGGDVGVVDDVGGDVGVVGDVGGDVGVVGGLSLDTDVVCLARVGTDSQKIVTVSLAKAAELDLGPPLHSLVIPGHCHFLEQDSLNLWRP